MSTNARRAVEHLDVTDKDLGVQLKAMLRTFLDARLTRAAATIHFFRGEHEAALQLSTDAPIDAARCLVAAGRYREAADAFGRAGWVGHAALQLEQAGDHRGARALWERLAGDPRLRDELYVRGLVQFNASRNAEQLQDRTASRRAAIESMHLLQAAADAFEAQGKRERAFDCFGVLLTIGKGGAFENLAEGYLNCIRILQEDNLKYYVLQYYEDFQGLALEKGELHAAATLFREAADYSERHRLPYTRHYRLRAAETYVAAARRTAIDGGSVRLAENAYAAAIDIYNELGLYSRVREVYDTLANLPLGEARQERYARLERRMQGVQDEDVVVITFPDYLRMDTAYPETWKLDVIEWEQAGDATEAMGEVLQQGTWSELTRRRALVCRLHQLTAGDEALAPHSLATLAAHLGRVELYAALAPLERLMEHDQPSVRTACVRAARQLFFKRSFGIVAAGLKDSVRDVQAESIGALSALHFPHALEPLARICRESMLDEARIAALSSIARIPTAEAADVLVDVLREGRPKERQRIVELLSRTDHPELTRQLKELASEGTGPASDAAKQILRTRRG